MTKTPSKCLAYLGPDAPHRFDAASGWCLNGCGLRQDGRHTTTAGSLIDPGPEYTPEALATIATKLRERKTYEQHDRTQPTLDLPVVDA